MQFVPNRPECLARQAFCHDIAMHRGQVIPPRLKQPQMLFTLLWCIEVKQSRVVGALMCRICRHRILHQKSFALASAPQ